VVVRVQGEGYTSYVGDIPFFVAHLRALGNFPASIRKLVGVKGQLRGCNMRLCFEASSVGGTGCKRGGSKVLT